MSNAQIGRQFGARRLILDNNDGIAANNLFLIDLGGNLGIDNTGLVTGTYPAAATLVSLKLGAKTTGINIAGGGTSLLADGNIITTGNSNSFGSGSATNNVLVVNGIADATVLSTAANTVWDMRVNGDQLVTGIQKIGGSIWMDGTSNPHQILTDQNLNFGTKNATSLNILSNNISRLTLDGNGNVRIGQVTPMSLIANIPFSTNIIGSNNDGENTGSFTWTMGLNGYVASFCNPNTGTSHNGVMIKIADNLVTSLALDISLGAPTALSSPSLFSVRGNGSTNIGNDIFYDGPSHNLASVGTGGTTLGSGGTPIKKIISYTTSFGGNFTLGANSSFTTGQPVGFTVSPLDVIITQTDQAAASALGIVMQGYAVAPNTINFVVYNPTGSAINFTGGGTTVRVTVIQY